MKRTYHLDELTSDNNGEKVSLAGWVDRRRDLGGVIFIDLRDKHGKTQVVFNPEHDKELHALADNLRNEWVIHIEGAVRSRPEGMTNPKLHTGQVEVLADSLTILNKAKNPPLSINEYSETSRENEDVRLRYRYLDLRRPWIQRNIILKSKFLGRVHNFFRNTGFEEIETPVLCKSTPEGARDYLVPSRVNPGKFYALPQSPQTYKQLLMIAGFDRYYQIAKCFRDEDLRADRQPEFLQIDVEMSFVDREDVYETFDRFVKEVVAEVWPQYEYSFPIPRMSWKDAMEKYGSDKPDLRFSLEIHDVSDIAAKCGFGVFNNVVKSGGVVRGIAATGCVDFTRKVIDELTDFVGRYGSKGLVWMRVKEEGVETQVGKFFKDGELDELNERLGGNPGDMLFFVAGPEKMVSNALGQLRLEIARQKGLADPRERHFVWITDFPMFEFSEGEGRWTAMHHPFTAPVQEHLPMLEKGEHEGMISQGYDLVLNGVEIGGGSIRIHDPEVQKQAFQCLSLSDEEVEEKFGYFVDAFQYGAPPHGGLAFGVDRILATMENMDSIRDFIPFPKTSTAASLMDESPSEVDPMQLHEIHIGVRLPQKD